MNKLGRMMMLNNGGRKMSIEYEDDGRRDRRHDVEDRYRDSRGREHYDNGRYAPMDDMRRTPMGYAGDVWTPPYYDDDKVIGFDRSNATRSTDKHTTQAATMARAVTTGSEGMTAQIAEEWASKMQNEDGTTGPHWSMDQVKTVMQQRGIDFDLPEFYAALNMIYSDYVNVAKKLGISNIDFYVGMAQAFLDDKDAGKDKLLRYYRNVVK